jgi:hypothetical protein
MHLPGAVHHLPVGEVLSVFGPHHVYLIVGEHDLAFVSPCVGTMAMSIPAVEVATVREYAIERPAGDGS